MSRRPSTSGNRRLHSAHASSWGRLSVLSALLFQAPHAAAGETIEMPPECGSREEFTRELERLLGERAAEGHPLSLVISGKDTEGVHTLRLQLRTETRELKDSDCRALFRSAVVISAASVRPEIQDAGGAQTAERPEPSRRILPPRAQASRAELKGPAPLRSKGEHETEPGWRGSFHSGGGAIVGVLPVVAPMLELSGALRHSSWGIFGALQYLPRARTSEAGRGVVIWALGGQLAMLFEPSLDWIRFSGGVTAHRLEGQGFGVAQSVTDSAWSVSPFLEGTVVPLLTRNLQVELGLQGYASIVRARFEIENHGEIYRVSPFAAAAVVRVAFPL
jgi:hypothetical protein